MAPTHEKPVDLKRLGEFLSELWQKIVAISSRGLDGLRKTTDNTSFERILEVCLSALDSLCRAFDGMLLNLGVGNIVASHPFASATTLVILSFVPIIVMVPFVVVLYLVFGILQLFVLGVLSCLGFGRRGVEHGSLAASYQSRNYGAFTPADSYFSSSQSYAATGMDSEPVNPFWHRVVSWILRGVAVMILFSYFFKLYHHPNSISTIIAYI